jgi:hypothetical protein
MPYLFFPSLMVYYGSLFPTNISGGLFSGHSFLLMNQTGTRII